MDEEAWLGLIELARFMNFEPVTDADRAAARELAERDRTES